MIFKQKMVFIFAGLNFVLNKFAKLVRSFIRNNRPFRTGFFRKCTLVCLYTKFKQLPSTDEEMTTMQKASGELNLIKHQ